jgi:hypothetical protein
VGALKHAHVGVALLASSSNANNAEMETKRRAKIQEAQQLSNEMSTAAASMRNRLSLTPAQNVNNQQSIMNAQVNMTQKHEYLSILILI